MDKYKLSLISDNKRYCQSYRIVFFSLSKPHRFFNRQLLVRLQMDNIYPTGFLCPTPLITYKHWKLVVTQASLFLFHYRQVKIHSQQQMEIMNYSPQG